MNIPKEDVKVWLDRGKRLYKATHVLIIIDRLYSDYYPVFVLEMDNMEEVISKYSTARYTISEAYDLSMDLEEQLNQDRAFNF